MTVELVSERSKAAVDVCPLDGSIHLMTIMPLRGFCNELQVEGHFGHFPKDLYIRMRGWLAAISWAKGGCVLFHLGSAFGREGERSDLALCLSFLPTKICDSCVRLVTGYG